MFSSSCCGGGDGVVNNNDNSNNPFQQLLQLSSSSSCSSTMSDQSHGLSSSPYLTMFDPEITNTTSNNSTYLCSQYPYPPNNNHGQLMTLPFLLPTYPYHITYPDPPPPTPPHSVSCNLDNNANEMMMLMGSSGGKEIRMNVKKKERHSKIETATGVRDRRVRLSIGTSRKFFDLQDMLGFDKPSKTLDWLLSHSEPAIHRLQQLQRKPTTGDIMELENEEGDDDDDNDGDGDHDQEHEALLLNQHLQEMARATRTKDRSTIMANEHQQEPFGFGRVVSNSNNSLFTTTTTAAPEDESFMLMKWNHLKHPASSSSSSSSLTTTTTINHAIPSSIFPHHQNISTASTWDINAATLHEARVWYEHRASKMWFLILMLQFSCCGFFCK